VNIVILEEAEVGARLPRGDRRWEHVKKVLKKLPGDSLAAGLRDGSLGRALVVELDDSSLVLDFEAFEGPAAVPPALAPLRLLLGFPRPIQAARILKDLTSLGVAEIHLMANELGEKSYAQSSIFKDRDFHSHLLEGAEQAGNPRLPRVFTHWSLRRCLEALAAADTAASPRPRGDRIFLHPYGDFESLGQTTSFEEPLTLAIGSERGWTGAEIEALGASGFVPRSLGTRILKTETAVLAATVLGLARLGRL
jgi:16S rRNA (uracil1498-N3)-methyltransferase